jgi:hypothetical protein
LEWNGPSVASIVVRGDLVDGGNGVVEEDMGQAEDMERGDGDDEDGGLTLPGTGENGAERQAYNQKTIRQAHARVQLG